MLFFPLAPTVGNSLTNEHGQHFASWQVLHIFMYESVGSCVGHLSKETIFSHPVVYMKPTYFHFHTLKENIPPFKV